MKCSNLLRVAALKLFTSLEAQSGDGWKDSLGWVSLETAKRSGKPAMVFIHKPECPSCRRLKGKLLTHPGVARLSPSFAMVQMLPEELPDDDDDDEADVFHPDGRYVPRILFFDAEFNFLPEIRGPLLAYQYNYSEPDDIEFNMERVLRMTTRS